MTVHHGANIADHSLFLSYPLGEKEKEKELY